MQRQSLLVQSDQESCTTSSTQTARRVQCMKRRVVLVDEAIDLPFRMPQQEHGGRPEPRLHKLAATRRGFAIQEGLHLNIGHCASETTDHTCL